MTSDTPPSRTVDPPAPDKSGSSTAINALIGAAAGIILSFVPFSTLLGGAIAGYLKGGDARDGLSWTRLNGSGPTSQNFDGRRFYLTRKHRSSR